MCYNLESTQTLHAQNDKENCVDFYNSIFPGEAKMCLGFMSFRAPPVALKRKNWHNSTTMQAVKTYFQGRFKFKKRHILVIFVFVLGMLHFSGFLFLINFQ